MQSMAPSRIVPQEITTSIQGMQLYIQQLTAYINENNNKYNRNIETLQIHYEQQLQELNDSLTSLQEQALLMKNQNNSLKDILLNRNQQLKQNQGKALKNKQQLQEVQEKVHRMQKYLDQIHSRHEDQRTKYQLQLEKQESKTQNILQANSQLQVKLKEKESEIKTLNNRFSRLQLQLAERYSLPDKIKQCQITKAKNQTQIQQLSDKATSAERERDFLKTENQKLKKECQKLRIQSKTLRSQVNYKIEVQTKKIREESNDELQSKSVAHERVLFELHESQNCLKDQVSRKRELQGKVKEQFGRMKMLEQTVSEMSQEKQLYVNEFRKLKSEYESVISNLEEAVQEYQKKNWALQQENRQLNAQLDGLQQLLHQIRGMNNLDLMKKQYRQWAEAELLAQKQHIKNKKQLIQPGQKLPSLSRLDKLDDYGTELDDQRWKGMMADIDNIRI